jgi:hypothetical protein
MQNRIPSAVQLRYTCPQGPLVRSDGKTQPIALDDIERLYGEYVLEEVMSSPGRWVDVTAPEDAVVAATVNKRIFTVQVVPADSLASDFIVDVDAGTITLPINARLFSLISALHTAKQHEPTIQTQPAPRAHRCRCWSRRGGEIVIVILPGIGKREIPMEHAAGHPELRDIFNKVRDAETEAHRWNGDTPPAGKAFVELSDAEVQTLCERQPLPQLRPITTRPVQLSQTAWGTKPAA